MTVKKKHKKSPYKLECDMCTTTIKKGDIWSWRNKRGKMVAACKRHLGKVK